MKEHEIVRAGIGRKFQTPSIYENLTVFENLEMSFPRGRWVFGALASSDAEVGTGCGRSPHRFSSAISSTDPPNFSATDRSNGWRSACC